MNFSKYCLIIFFSLIALSLTASAQQNLKSSVPKVYKLDLDKDYKEMWQQLVTDYKPQILDLVDTFIDQLKLNSFPTFGYKMLSWLLKFYHDKDFIAEVQAIADILDMEFSKVFLMNFIYEIGEFACTSIVAQNTNNQIFHGRNLDYGNAGKIAAMTVQGEFYRNGNLVYTALITAGNIGTTTGMKYGQFGISIDERDNSTAQATLYEIIFNKRSKNVMYFTRQLLEQPDFESAVQIIQFTPLDATVYYIISGNQKDQGAIVARYDTAVENYIQLNSAVNWYIVVTNYDTDYDGNPSHLIRQKTAISNLNKLQQENLNNDSLFNDVMIQSPTKNPETILTVIMSAQTNYFNTTIWQ